MQAALVRIGNSQGIRLPKAAIEQAGLGKLLELEVVEGGIMIRPARDSRAGWAQAAADCVASGCGDLADWDVTTADGSGDWE